jgi:hypothetical protein
LSQPRLRPVRRLNEDDDLAAFDCGTPVLNEWLARFALADHQAGSSVTYVLARESRVVGFYTVAPGMSNGLRAPTRASRPT